jgi:hypothetical protein
MARGTDDIVFHPQTSNGEAMWQEDRRGRARKYLSIDVENHATCPTDSMVMILGRPINPQTIAGIRNSPTKPGADKGIQRLIDRRQG